MDSPDELMTVKEVMAYLKLSKTQVHHLLKTGEIGRITVNVRNVRVRRSDLERYIQSRYQPAKGANEHDGET